jgi:hypothetical protein
VSTSRSTGTLAENAYTQGLDSGNSTQSPTFGPLSVYASLDWWYGMLFGVTNEIAPVGKISLFHTSLVANQLASLRLAYYGESL